MSETHKTNTKGKQVAVVVGATSKWQSDGRNTLLAHGKTLDDSDLPVGVRWGVGGAIAQKFAQEGFFVVLTTRNAANASALADAIRAQGGECMIVELDLVSQDSIAAAFATIRRDAGDPDVLIYNAGYLEGRDLPPEKELLEYIPVEMFDTAQHIASRGPFLVAKEVLPAMRKKGAGSFFFSNNSSSLRGAQADDRAVALLSQGHDAHAGAGADRGILGARRARGQRGDRRHHRLTRYPRDADGCRTGPISSSIRSRSPRRSSTCTPRTGRAGRTSFSSRHFRPSRATDGVAPAPPGGIAGSPAADDHPRSGRGERR